MALDEYIFSKVAGYFRNRRSLSAEISERIVYLEDIRPRLTILARAVTAKAIDIFPAEREGGYKNNNFFLPISFSLFLTHEENLSYYFYRVLFLAIQQRMNFNWGAEVTEPSLELCRQKARDSATIVLPMLFEEFPLTQQLHHLFLEYMIVDAKEKQQVDYSWLYGKWMKNEIEVMEPKLKYVSERIKTAIENKPSTIIKKKTTEEILSVQVDKQQQEDYVLTHNFEKVETADDFNGGWRDIDGDDELEDHQEALDELNVKFTVRLDDTAHSVYQADFLGNANIAESAEFESDTKGVLYDEWDYSKRKYKENFCRVFPIVQKKTDNEYYLKTIKKNATVLIGLRKMLANLNNKTQQQRRQAQGDEFDIDAITDLVVDVHSKQTPSELIYLSQRKKEKDLSILLLLDISLSSDGYAAGNRVIDVEKQVSILFGEILAEFNIDFSISCFYSKTRSYSSFLTLKDFDEGWSTAKNRIGTIEPQGYTRIGAALRHAGALLDKRRTKNKWVILISDGKPNDYDRYEGRYGINDVKQALRELYERGVNSYALAIEAQAKYYLPLMFGQNHYQILTTPNELLRSMVVLYEKIRHQS